ncbi:MULTISPECIES: SGNH/GDSL hydrolase family protein [unclassified Microbacterium]|uniref:SGNH/GDSL hydrolase family protein n=1 Tax=unclassified Microbacterium TaxID=2609290 RepID=UPI000EAA0F8B|nr:MULTISPECIES: SGNH/GDSL hydrolase family protein [unclassified Microbacterium]MBT2485825.1 SGNH/GDSL hydrolase family protein [Microbacterium sp. ISL-108]RKN68588.1 SGNH/GDSL hydrolase family protein [Microbacterium sp. CGR2]
MALPVGVTQLGTFGGAPGEKGDPGSIDYAEVEVIAPDAESYVEMVGTASSRGAIFHLARPIASPVAVGNDVAFSEAISTPTTETAQALAARYADVYSSQLRSDPGMSRFAGKFAMGLPCTLQIAGDSTGNDVNEWAYKLMQAIAALAPNARLEYQLWADATKNYPTTQVIQAGTYVPPFDGQAVLDTFTRTGALAGSVADTGQTWTTNGTGVWTLDGSKAVLTNSAVGAVHTIDSGKRGEMTSRALAVEIDTSPGAVAKQFAVYCAYATNSDHLWVYINVSTTGVVTWGIFKRVGGTAALIATGGALGLTPNAVNTFDVEIGISGSTVTAIANGVTTTTTLSATEVELFTSGNARGGIGSPGAATGFKVAGFSIHAHELMGQGQLIRFRNGSYPGASIAYHQTNLDAVIPTEPDVVYVSLGHNQNVMSPVNFVAAMDAYWTSVKAKYPTTKPVAVPQNPQFPPLPAAPFHAPRAAALRAHAFEKGWGYMPVFEAFWSLPDHGQSLIMPDGVHPLDTGSQLWADVAIAHFIGNAR